MVNRVALLLGAGASCPFGYPTTKQFFERIKISDTVQEVIFNSIKELQSVKDIEHVLQLLDIILPLGNSNITAKYFGQIIPSIKLFNTQLTWQDYIEKCSNLKALIIDKIFQEYHFKNKTKEKAFDAFDNLFNILDSNGLIMKNIFSLNYDRLIEEYFIEGEKDFVDGFTQVKQRRLWRSDAFNAEIDVDKAPYKLLKLHGSLSWREYEDTIECVTTEEPSRSSYHKKNVFIYPTQLCDESAEPYFTMYNYFKSLKENAEILIVIGYAFRDPPINNVIINFLHSINEPQVIVISPTALQDLKIIQEKISGSSSANKRLMVIEGEYPSNDVFNNIAEIVRGVKIS